MIVERKRTCIMPWNPPHYNHLWGLNEQGLSYIQMAKIMGRTSAAVQFQLQQLGWAYKHKITNQNKGNPGKEYVPNISKTILKHKNGKLVNYSSNKDYNQSWRI